jgi:ArsR family transcriptional regulator, arsenate/arsenite/antimonite-responsive transcriptional repressor
MTSNATQFEIAGPIGAHVHGLVFRLTRVDDNRASGAAVDPDVSRVASDEVCPGLHTFPLTPGHLFDSYQTMNQGRGIVGTLAPGQFERIAKALADPRRFSLLQTVAEAPQECAFQKLCSVFPVTKATISHHMKELVTAGLVETERDGQYMHARVVPGVIEAYTAELQRRVGGSG